LQERRSTLHGHSASDAPSPLDLRAIPTRKSPKMSHNSVTWVNVLTYTISVVARAIRILPPEVHGQTVGLMAIRRLFQRGVVTYGTFVAEKL
jgi:hypothetical protein